MGAERLRQAVRAHGAVRRDTREGAGARSGRLQRRGRGVAAGEPHGRQGRHRRQRGEVPQRPGGERRHAAQRPGAHAVRAGPAHHVHHRQRRQIAACRGANRRGRAQPLRGQGSLPPRRVRARRDDHRHREQEPEQADQAGGGETRRARADDEAPADGRARLHGLDGPGAPRNAALRLRHRADGHGLATRFGRSANRRHHAARRQDVRGRAVEGLQVVRADSARHRGGMRRQVARVEVQAWPRALHQLRAPRRIV